MAHSTVESSQRPKMARASNGTVETVNERANVAAAGHQAFWLLRITFTIPRRFSSVSTSSPTAASTGRHAAQPTDQQHRSGSGHDYDVRRRRHRDRSRTARGGGPKDRGVRRRGLAVRDRHQPADQERTAVLRHRPARFRPDAGGSDLRPSRAGGRSRPQVRSSAAGLGNPSQEAPPPGGASAQRVLFERIGSAESAEPPGRFSARARQTSARRSIAAKVTTQTATPTHTHSRAKPLIAATWATSPTMKPHAAYIPTGNTLDQRRTS